MHSRIRSRRKKGFHIVKTLKNVSKLNEIASREWRCNTLTRLSFTLRRINTSRRTNKAQRRQTVAFSGKMQAQTDVNVRSPQKYTAWIDRDTQNDPKIRGDAAPVAPRVKSNESA